MLKELNIHIAIWDHSITYLRRLEEREGVCRKPTLGHVTKGRYHVKCPHLSTRGGEGGQNLVTFRPRSC